MADRNQFSPRTWSHYDLLSTVYDPLTKLFYGHAQRTAVASLRARPGDVVLDVACGTGMNFEYLLPNVTNSGLVIGLEYSSGMIERAARRIRRHGWEEPIRLCQCDARELSREHLVAVVPRDRTIDRVLFSLVLSVLPDWEQIFLRGWELLRSGGRCTILDQYFPRRGLVAHFTEHLASADLSRRVWEPLKEIAENDAQEDVALLCNYPSQLVVASGMKP